MGRQHHTAEEIINKLREAEVGLAKGLAVPEVCRKLGVAEQTYYRWRKEYGGLRREQAKRLRELEQENLRLKKLVANLSLDNAILKEAAQGKLLSPAKRRQAVAWVRNALGHAVVSERRACQVLGQERSTQRRWGSPADDEGRLLRRMVELATEYGALRLPTGDRPAARGGFSGEPQAGRAALAAGRAEGAGEAAEAGAALVDRRLLR